VVDERTEGASCDGEGNGLLKCGIDQYTNLAALGFKMPQTQSSFWLDSKVVFKPIQIIRVSIGDTDTRKWGK
jgi:hypothetical protein